MTWNKRDHKVFSRELKHFLHICNQSKIVPTLSRYNDVSIPVILKHTSRLEGADGEGDWEEDRALDKEEEEDRELEEDKDGEEDRELGKTRTILYIS